MVVECNHVRRCGAACRWPDTQADPGGLQRPDGRHAPRRPRPDHRLDCAADHRGRPRRPRPPVVGGHRLPVDHHRQHAALREAVRHLRPPTDVPVGHRHLRRRIGPVRALPGHAPTHRVSRRPGDRSRWPDGHGVRHHRRHRLAPGARPLHRLPGGGLRSCFRRGTTARWVLRRQPHVAMGLLRQRADRDRRPGHHELRAAPTLRPPGPRDRLRRSGTARGRGSRRCCWVWYGAAASTRGARRSSSV